MGRLIDEWKNDFKGYVNALNIPRDDYNGIMAYIDELPSTQPTLCGYDIEHLMLIAIVLKKENLPPEKVVEALTNIERIISMVRAEFEESLREAAINAFDNAKFDVEYCTKYGEGYNDGIDFVVSELPTLLSTQPERLKGHWIDTGSGQECSECGEVQYGYDNFRYYCAKCGSDNRGK